MTNIQGNLNKDFNVGHGSIASQPLELEHIIDKHISCNCNKPIQVKIKKLYNDVIVPEQATSGSAGFDISAYLQKPILLQPLQRVMCPTGICVQMPEGLELQLRARSGNAIKKGLSLINGIGTIDSDFTGEINVLLVNLSNEEIIIKHGDKIAQGVFAKYESPKLIVVEELSSTERGTGGFGSTGS